MKIGLTYNLRHDVSESEAELLTQEDVTRLTESISRLKHTVIPIEVTGTAPDIVGRITSVRPELIFNVAEGVNGFWREAYYPAIYRMLGYPFTESDASTLYSGLDKRLTHEILLSHGIRVPFGVLLTKDSPVLPDDCPYPLIIKPNFEGSSKGIHQESVVENATEAKKYIKKHLEKYPEGLTAEEFIEGREVTVPWLEEWPGGLFEIVEWKFPDEGKYDILDYELKESGDREKKLKSECPADLTARERQNVMALAMRTTQVMNFRDFGRVDIRLSQDGTPFLIEANALPGLRPSFSLMIAARQKGLSFDKVINLIIVSASKRYNLNVAPSRLPRGQHRSVHGTAREPGITIGRFQAGKLKAITDVKGIRVGHITHIEDIDSGNNNEATAVRTGITAIVPGSDDYFNNHLVAGGFILNGIGEMSGLTQAIDWGWIETPILLTATMSIGSIHQGIIEYMLKKNPDLGRKLSVIIPLIGETDDSFLNDVRLGKNTVQDAIDVIEKATDGPVQQGSVGGGTGMISFDFSGGIGTSSRIIHYENGQYTLGVLVQSNFGKMCNLTIEGKVTGRELDTLYPYEFRRQSDRGSVVVILATDAPMLSTQLTHLSKRAALGLGRVGSHATSTSGEIILAFSTANRTSRMMKETTRHLNLSFVTDAFINPLYEAAVEATEEAVINALFCSKGMDGRLERKAPPIPTNVVIKMLKKN